ncbi:kinase-like domain-containing protein [Dipodascopsis tothii]|uniref:kinase-like domain-containing protein n=1 Tax=Dipodascopsis tothii TaxID=44089 RepID=UPI0034CEE146
MSTGLLSKRDRQSNTSEASHFAPPDTPCKRPSQPQFTTSSLDGFDSSDTTPAESPAAPGNFDIKLGRTDYELPPTPTKVLGGRPTSAPSSRHNSSTATSNASTPTDPHAKGIPLSPSVTGFPELKTPSTPAKGTLSYFEPIISTNNNLDAYLLQRYDEVSLIGSGEFSSVFLVNDSSSPISSKYAVKRTKYPIIGQKSRDRKMEEVEILRALNANRNDEGRNYIVNMVDTWEHQEHLYIMTEYCDNGNLDVFLAECGRVSKLDEWRVWKILLETALGLRYIHEQGYMHLDLKPANIFITFEGTLKIGDFGMATSCPAAKGIEREGDREYIAPEVLALQKYGQPADIFSFGLVMLEIAANIVLPDNGLPWQKLRSGDLSDAGKLSSSSGDLSSIDRVAPDWIPPFMCEGADGLDNLVKWMLSPEPSQRPTVSDILMTDEVKFVEARRKSGAVIFEGEYGPIPDTMEKEDDISMLDEDEVWRMII